MASTFEITQAKDGDYHFHLKAANGQIILTSQMYKEKSSAEGGVESVKKNAPNDHSYERKESHNGSHVQSEGGQSPGDRYKPTLWER